MEVTGDMQNVYSLRMIAAAAAYEIVRRERIGVERSYNRMGEAGQQMHKSLRDQLHALRDREADLLAIITEAPL